MNSIARAGLLPLYLELYDQRLPQMRRVLEPFLRQVIAGLESHGIDVVTAPIGRRRDEFEQAVGRLERQEADAIVTLHLAYSPSLESAEALSRTTLPVILCDTTMDESFGPEVDPERLLYNHGIHGVQDLASILRRWDKPFRIVAGHVEKSDVLGRTADLVRAAHAARSLRGTRALRLGDSFPGMGDFAVPEGILWDALGVRVEQLPAEMLVKLAAEVTAEQIDAELSADRRQYDVTASEEVHRRSVRAGLALRKCLSDGQYTAFSMNFAAFTWSDGPLDTVPFLEASKAMARGIGYAGEGDVLTASLVGALCRGFGQATFTEIFCPDWNGQSLFLSHMGEINPAVAAARPVLCEKQFPWTGTRNPAILACAPRPGPGVLVNIAPGPKNSFSVIVAPVEVLGDGTHPEFREHVRAWVRPRRPVAEFLEAYSHHGGTHHSALVLGATAEAIQAFAGFAGLECVAL